MKRILTLIIVFALFLLPMYIFSQERVNVPLPIISIPLKSIEKALGCRYDENTKRWIERQNYISPYDKIIKYEIRECSYQNKEYVLILKYQDSGYYDYPSLRVGFHPYTKALFYAIDKNEYFSKTNNINDPIGLLEFNVIAKSDVVDDRIEAQLANQLAIGINKGQKNIETLYIQYKNLPDLKKVRFLMYDQTCREGYRYISDKERKKMKKDNASPKDYMQCSYGGFEIPIMPSLNADIYNSFTKDDIFNFLYFETDYDAFHNFITL